MTEPLSLRPYQREIVEEIWKSRRNYLVVLPTGTGKSFIAFELLRREVSRGGRAVMFTPTRALARQHFRRFSEAWGEAGLITGDVSPSRRVVELQRPVLFATPHSLLELPLPEFTLAVFDECHHTVKNHAYAKMARRLTCWKVGFTASPGVGERLTEIKANLGITDAVVKTLEDPSLRKHLPGLKVSWIRVELGEYLRPLKLLKEVIKARTEVLTKMGIPVPRRKSEFLRLPEVLQTLEGGPRIRAFITYSQLVHLHQMQEYLETQDASLVLSYWGRVGATGKRGIVELSRDATFQRFLEETRNLGPHPKLLRLKELLTDLGGKGIVFTQYREMAFRLRDFLGKGEVFLGRSGKKGLEALEKFREEGELLIATSVAEEGIDVPSVDWVVFYEAVPSEIRNIQRRGRAGRVKQGKVFVLLARGTRDEAYYFSARRKERRMVREVSSLGPVGLERYL